MPKRSLAIWTGLLAGLATLIAPVAGSAQGGPLDNNVALAYEGFSTNPDGSYELWFGYFNRNWDREFNVPVGPDNHIEPSGPDGVSRRTSSRGGISSCSA